jgi:YaiO family outer membrane protein
MLKERLAQSPDDTDARVLYGAILSWEGRYDESRDQLSEVLAKKPGHGDALPALINVELWSDHPQRAEQLAEEALRSHPDDPALLLQQARALINLQRSREAVRTLDHLLTVDPRNRQAARMRTRLKERSYRWELSEDHFYDHLSSPFGPQHEQWVSLRYISRRISVTPRFERAYRFGLVSQQFEVDAYPKFRPGSYAYVNFGWSPDNVLYPRNRVGADLFQNFRYGIEVSGGFRRLNFSRNSRIHIYTASLGKYYGNWLFTGRTYLTPDIAGLSHAVVVSARRFWGENGDHDYLDIRYSNGASLEQVHTGLETQVLDSNGAAVEYDKTIFSRWSLDFKGGYSQEDRLVPSAVQPNGTVQRNGIHRFSFRATLYFRF